MTSHRWIFIQFLDSRKVPLRTSLYGCVRCGSSALADVNIEEQDVYHETNWNEDCDLALIKKIHEL